MQQPQLTTFWIAFVTISFNYHREGNAMKIFNITTDAPRLQRSGGFPKFPIEEPLVDVQDNQPFNSQYLNDMKPDECGTRIVRFHPHRRGRIVGGTVPPYGAYPWQVEIQMFRHELKAFEHHCGGAVIGERLVLTAAHCLEVTQMEYLRLVIGDHSLKERDLHEHSFRVERILIHPLYRKSGPYSHDIAIIKVKASSAAGIGFNTHVRPICIPDEGQTPEPGTWCSVTGWGTQKAGDVKSVAPVLRAAAVPLLDLDTCRMSSINGGRRQEILDTMLCAGFLQGGVDACGGDSGGPLACEYNNRFVLSGLVSWGDGCAKKNRPGVYTRVESFRDWIYESIDILERDD